MKKRKFILVFIVLIALAASTCKKKYPKDIPKWLKEKINTMDNERRGKGCRYEICRTVEEYTDGSSTFYRISSGFGSPMGYDVFNYYGEEQCAFDTSSPNNACFIQFRNNKFVRLIWEES